MFRICHLALLITAIVNITYIITIIMPKDSKRGWSGLSKTLPQLLTHISLIARETANPKLELLITNIMFGCAIVLT